MKIFLTVGSMLPFDRLVRAIDTWAKEHPDIKIIAQIGKTNFIPENMEYQAMLSPSEYLNYFSTSDFVVSHVGMGTVITAMECKKPLLMLPRRPELKEATSNHQMATAKWLENSPGIRVVYNENELSKAISEVASSNGISPMLETGNRDRLIELLRQFVAN